MRDATSEKQTVGKRTIARRRFLRACAVALAIASFTSQSSLVRAQSLDTLSRNVQYLTADGTLARQTAQVREGDRKSTAALVAQRIDELDHSPASRADIESLRELIFALKDELDAANIRIDILQERLDAAAAAPPWPPITPSQHVGAPLDPLAALYTDGSRVATALWGAEYLNMASILARGEIRRFATSFDAAELASLDTPDSGEAYGDVAIGLFGREAMPSAFLTLAFHAPASVMHLAKALPNHVTAATPKADLHALNLAWRPSVTQNEPQAAVTSSVDLSARHEVATTLTSRLHVQSAQALPGNRLAGITQTNADFDRDLRAAGELSDTASNGAVTPIFTAFEQSTLVHGDAVYRAYMPSATTSGALTVPLKVGHTKVSAKTSLQHLDQGGATSNVARYDAANVDTSFAVPAFHQHVTINVRGGYDRLRNPDTTTLPYYPTSTGYDIPSASGETAASASVAANPNNPDVQRYTYGASANLPVAHNLNVGVGYSSQHLSGTYGLAAGEPAADRKDAYSGSLTYASHGGKSSVSLIGGESLYSDSTSTTATVKQTHENVLFSVKF